MLPGGPDPHLGLLRHPREGPPCPADTPHLCEKVILQQVVQAGPLGRIGGQQAGDEAARVGRQVCRLGVAAISDVLVHLRQGSRHEGRDASQHHVPGRVGGRKQGTCLDLFWASRVGSHLPVYPYPQSLTPFLLHTRFLTPALRPLSPSHSCLHRRHQHLSVHLPAPGSHLDTCIDLSSFNLCLLTPVPILHIPHVSTNVLVCPCT